MNSQIPREVQDAIRLGVAGLEPNRAEHIANMALSSLYGEEKDLESIESREERASLKALDKFFHECVRIGLQPDAVGEDLSSLSVPTETVELIKECWKTNLSVISRHVVTDATVSVRRLNDMEWRFGVTTGSSELEQVGATFLQLKLDLEGRTEIVEMSLGQFYEFMSSMEKARAALEYM